VGVFGLPGVQSTLGHFQCIFFSPCSLELRNRHSACRCCIPVWPCGACCVPQQAPLEAHDSHEAVGLGGMCVPLGIQACMLEHLVGTLQPWHAFTHTPLFRNLCGKPAAAVEMDPCSFFCRLHQQYTSSTCRCGLKHSIAQAALSLRGFGSFPCMLFRGSLSGNAPSLGGLQVILFSLPTATFESRVGKLK